MYSRMHRSKIISTNKNLPLSSFTASLGSVFWIVGGIAVVGTVAAVTLLSIGGIQLEIMFAVAAGLTLSLLPALLRTSRHDGDLFEISNLFILLYALSSFSLPVSFLVSGEAGLDSSIDHILPAVVLCTLGAVGFWMGYLSPQGGHLGKAFALRMEYDDRGLFLVAWLFIGVGFVLMGFLIWFVGWSTYINAISLEKHRLTLGLGQLFLGINLIDLGIVLLFYRAFRQRGRWAFLLPSILLAGVIGFAFFCGMRRHILLPLMALLILYHYKIRPIRFRTLAIPSLVILPIFLTFGYYRGILTEDLDEIKLHFLEHASWTWLDPGRSYFGAPFSNLTRILSEVPRSIPYVYGLTYLQTIVVILPSSLYPDRPLSPAEWFSREFYPNEYYAGGARGFFVVTEAYWNFGLFGVPVVLFVIGLFLRALYVICIKERSIFGIIMYGFCAPWPILALIVIGFSAAVKLGLIHIFFVLLSAFLLRKMPVSSNIPRQIPR